MWGYTEFAAIDATAMKYAAAMKYGGELILAQECNYDSFRELVPLCPECKEPVYLRAGGDRLSTKGKPYKIGAHWCHFKGVSDEQVAACENRVNNYSEQEKQRIAAKARGQRLKLLQRWFWDVYSRTHHPDLTRKINDQNLIAGHTSNLIDGAFGEFESAPASKVLNMFFEFHLGHWITDCRDFGCTKDLQEYFPEVVPDPVKYDESPSVDWKILSEVMDFLCSPKSLPLLQEIVGRALVPCRDVEEYLERHQHLAIHLIADLGIIPWSAEFQRLEQQSKAA